MREKLPGIIDANCLFGLWPRGELDASLPTVRQLLWRTGVQGALVGSLQAALGDQEDGNAEALRACREWPAALPVAGLQLRRAVHVHDEVSALKRGGFAMLRLFREYEGWPVDFAPLQETLQAATYWGLPVMLAITQPGDLTALGRLLARVPCAVIATGVNVSHTPLVTEAIAVARDSPTLHFETSRLEGVGTLDLMAGTIGAERLVFGTGLPFQYPSSAAGLVRESELSEHDMKAVLGANIARLVGMDNAGR